MTETSSNLWGGRFSTTPEASMFALSRSVHFDWRLAPYDLRSSLAHVNALESQKIISSETAAQLRTALQQLQLEVRNGSFLPSEGDEDVHSALERGLKEKLGEIGGAIRAGRSRNDQVATDFRLYLIDHMIEIAASLVELESAITELASEYVDDVAPGFTHLQHAQPVSFGHELAKHAHAISRDISRISDWLKRTNFSPLGSGALSGSSLPLQPEKTAMDLGFAGVVANSIDAVMDRDFAAEALFIIALVGVHISRIGEEWTLWSSTEFGWAKLHDSFSTGSSIMPQKKNPDAAEIARGKSGRFIGNLTGLLTVMKGLAFAYNRDLQEDKEPVFDSIENLLLLLPALSGMISTTTFDRSKMKIAAPLGFSLATEIADFLVRQGVPFSQAHEVAGKCVSLCEAKGIELHQLDDVELLNIHPKLTSEVRKNLDALGAIEARTTSNGTAPSSVRLQLKNLKSQIAEDSKWINDERTHFSGMMGQ
ncbi:MAG: argininosuccinate lyase [Actinomycetota bacterium]